MSAEDNAALVLRVYEAWNDRNFDAAVALATDDIETRRMASGQAFTGHEGFREFMKPFATAFPDMKKDETYAVEVVGIRDGKVASIRNYTDMAAVLRQLGVTG